MAYLHFDRIASEGKKASPPSRFSDLTENQNPKRTLHTISNILLTQARHIDNDPWRGLPELTQHSQYLLLDIEQ